MNSSDSVSSFFKEAADEVGKPNETGGFSDSSGGGSGIVSRSWSGDLVSTGHNLDAAKTVGFTPDEFLLAESGGDVQSHRRQRLEDLEWKPLGGGDAEPTLDFSGFEPIPPSRPGGSDYRVIATPEVKPAKPVDQNPPVNLEPSSTIADLPVTIPPEVQPAIPGDQNPAENLEPTGAAADPPVIAPPEVQPSIPGDQNPPVSLEPSWTDAGPPVITIPEARPAPAGDLNPSANLEPAGTAVDPPAITTPEVQPAVPGDHNLPVNPEPSGASELPVITMPETPPVVLSDQNPPLTEPSGKNGDANDVEGGDQLKLNEAKQGKHVEAHPNYQEGRSILTIDPTELASKLGTGEPRNDIPRGQAGFKECIDFGQNIGFHVDENSPDRVQTTTGIVHYAKDGTWHVVPTRPKQ